MRIENGCLVEVNSNDIISGEFKFPEGITSIGCYAFSGCRNLTRVTIPDSVTTIERWAFMDCSRLADITFSNSLKVIEEHAFKGCSNLISLVIPYGVMLIGWGAFERCSKLISITLPKSITKISFWSFYGCSDLISLVIPGGVTEIDCDAFKGCSKLINIFIDAEIPMQFERIKSLLPENLRNKAKDINKINKRINKHMNILEQHISTPADQGKETEWASRVNCSIQYVKSMLESVDSINIYKELQGRFHIQVLRFYINQNQLDEAIEHFNYCSNVPLDVVFELANALFVSEKPKKEKYQIMLQLFKEYDEYDDIHRILEKTVLELISVLAKEEGTIGKQLADYGISRCLPCSAIVQTIIGDRTPDTNLENQFKALETNLSLLTIKEMCRILNAPLLQPLFKKRYGSTDLVTYESLYMLSDLQEILPNCKPNGPFLGYLKEVLDFIKKIIDSNAESPIPQLNLGIFAQSSSSQQSGNDIINMSAKPF